MSNTIHGRRIPFHSYISKEVMSPGPSMSFKPKEKSTCTVFLSNIYIDDSVQLEHSAYFKHGDDVRDLSIAIGVADCELDRGLEHALCEMSVGEESKVLLHQDQDSSKEIVVFVKLIDCNVVPSIHKWSAGMKKEHAIAHKEKGNVLFKQKRVIDAFHRFSKAMKLIITIMDESPDKKELYNTLCSNMALCQLHFKNYEYVIDLCNKVLNGAPNHLKCLIRRMDAYVYLKDYDKAYTDCVKILEVEPNNLFASKQLVYIKKNLALQEARYVKMVKQMFIL